MSRTGSPWLWAAAMLSGCADKQPRFLDLDGDGFGGALATRAAIHAVERSGDCDDANATVFPGAVERCDGVDRDCDGVEGLVDPDSAPAHVRGFIDADGDGFGATAVRGCPQTLTLQGDDCDDADATRHPDALERCNGQDDDCDGLPDDGVGVQFYADQDGDGWGHTPTLACDRPEGHVAMAGDCDDLDPSVHPGAIERCDGIDNDCNGGLDSADDPVDGVPLYLDADLDGVGSDQVVRGCPGEPGYVSETGDCDDTDPLRTPGADELCDGIDNDCDEHLDRPDASFEGSVLGCDQCPAYSGAPLSVQTVNPCLLDPEATWGCFDGMVVEDTHQFGWRLHRAIRRDDTSQHRPGLLLYLPPSGSIDSSQIPQWAAELGFLTVVPDWYPSSRLVTKWCENVVDIPLCIDQVMHEVVFGGDPSDAIHVAPGNALVRELANTLKHLDMVDPGQGWGRVLQQDGSVDWSAVQIVAWSKGASPGALVAQQHVVAGFTALGPRIFPDRLIYTRPWATPGDRFRLVGHSYEWALNQVSIETVSGPSTGTDYTSPIDLDGPSWPWPADTAGFTTASGTPSQSCSPHALVAADSCMDAGVLQPAYRNLLCSL